MLLAFVVISNIYNLSSGWYTYLTESVSTKVCCVPAGINLGKAANNPSIRVFVISTNCRETIATTKHQSKRSILFGKNTYFSLLSCRPQPLLTPAKQPKTRSVKRAAIVSARTQRYLPLWCVFVSENDRIATIRFYKTSQHPSSFQRVTLTCACWFVKSAGYKWRDTAKEEIP